MEGGSAIKARSLAPGDAKPTTPKDCTPMLTPSRRAAAVVAYLICMLVIPVALTLDSITTPATVTLGTDNPSPLGYTISLSLFLFPSAALLFWMWRFQKLTFQRKAFLYTVALLAPAGIVLDVLFGNSFFVFENHHAVLGITFPARGGPIPIEEIVFYVFGFVTVLLLYVWCDEYWFEKYNVPDYHGAAAKIDHVLGLHWPSVFVGGGLIALAVVYRKLLAESGDGFPWYFIYLTSMALVPSMALYKTAQPFINWRAFSFTLFVIVLISLIWESTLALPYQWWDYQPRAMMGLFIGAWHNLPIEAVILWFAVSYATIIVFETIKIWLASGRTLRQLL
jgi:hypothetical protein